MKTTKEFWMVFGGGPCSQKHPSYESAFAEANRLAGLNPGKVFIVTRAVKAVCSTAVIEEVELVSEIPGDPN